MAPKTGSAKKALKTPAPQRGPIDDIPLYTAFPHIPSPGELLTDFEALLATNVLSNHGPSVRRFEAAVAQYLGHKSIHVTSVANGTHALELALRALGLKGKVIVPPFTFVASVNAIVNAGLEPVFADIDPRTLCLSPEAVDRALGSGAGAVMPVHVYGSVCDIYYFESLRKRGIKVIYDSAHAMGVEWNGLRMGKWGDAEAFSFHATKVLNACEGGAAVTQDPELAKRVMDLANFGIVSETEVVGIGTNAKMSEVHAVFGLHSLKYLDSMILHRRTLCDLYASRLATLPQIELLAPQPGVARNGQYFPIFLPSASIRDGLFEKLKEKLVFARRYFYPLIHQLRVYRHLSPGPLPVAEEASRRVLCLPLHAAMQEKHVDYVVDSIRTILSGLK